MPKLSLTIKGLILVSIPICFELGFVGILTHLQKEAEADAARALKAHQISDCINRLTAEYYQIWTSIHDNNGTIWTHRHFLEDTCVVPLKHLRADYAELDKLTEDRPQLNLSVKNSRALLDRVQSICDSVLLEIQAGHSSTVLANGQATISILRELYHGLIVKELSLVAQHEREFTEISNSRQTEIRNRVLQYALIAVFFNVIFSILLAIFLVKGVTSRLKIMSDNARLVAINEPLNPLLVGTDEIAELDRTFHWMNEALKQSARSRQEVFDMLTHDLRSPLTAIQGCLEMLTMHQEDKFGSLTERGERLVQLMARNSSLMMGLINDLLDLEKIDAGLFVLNTEPVCLAEVFEEVHALVAEWIQTHDIHIVMEDTALFVAADQALVTRVVYNLVSNAIKYSAAGGTIKVGVQEIGARVEVTVTDTGRGIPEHLLESIFDRFRQIDDGAHKPKGGSGLGLTICKAIITLHGGDIWVTSKVGEGSTFHFTLLKA